MSPIYHVHIPSHVLLHKFPSYLALGNVALLQGADLLPRDGDENHEVDDKQQHLEAHWSQQQVHLDEGILAAAHAALSTAASADRGPELKHQGSPHDGAAEEMDDQTAAACQSEGEMIQQDSSP